MNGTFRVRIEHSSGDPSAIRTVEVTIIVDTTVHELTLPTVDGVPVDMGSVEENILGSDADPLITGIGIDVSTGVTAADFEIRDNALGVFADKFQIEQNGADPTEWNLVLKDGEWLIMKRFLVLIMAKLNWIFLLPIPMATIPTP